MLRNKIQRLACTANTLAYVLVFGVVIIHVLHRRTAANVGPGDDQNVVFWFEAGDDGDDQPPFHRPFIISALVLVGAAGTFAVAALCDAGGITGTVSITGLFVPLYCLVAGFGLKEATSLAQAAIAGASLTSVAFSLFRSHPWDPTKPLLDLDLTLILAPASLLGVSVGVLLNDLLPNWLITALLVGLLAYVCRRKAVTGLTAMHEEAQHEAAQAAAAAISSGPVPRLRPICTASSDSSSPKEAVQAVQSHVCSDRSASKRGGAREAVQQAGQQQQQQWDGPQLPAAAAAATAAAIDVEVCDHLLSSSGSSDRNFVATAVAPATPAAAVCVPGAVAAAVDSSPGSSEALLSSGSLQQQQPGPFQSSPCQQLRQQQQQQQRQLSKQRNMCSGYSPSSSSEDLRAPLLDVNDGSPTAAAAAAAANAGDCSSSSRSTPPSRMREVIPIVPFMSSVVLPLPSLSPCEASHTITAPLAAAAAAGTCSSAVFAGHVISFSAFPWIKFFSLLMLCFGFFGLTILGGLIPLCSWYFVTYMSLFLGLTVLVTFVFVKVILIDPLAATLAYSKLHSTMEEGGTTAAAAAAARHGDDRGGRRLSHAERFVTWLNVITGTEIAAKRQRAAASEEEQQQGEGQQPSLHKTMSMFRRQQLKQQLEQQHPFLHQQHTFTNLQSAAAAAAEAHIGCSEFNAVDSSSVVVPQPTSLVHVAAAGVAVAGAAGVIAGVCGLAGGALLVPILLDFRVHPQVATATSVLLVCLSSITAVLAFLMQGRLDVSYALLFAGLAVLGMCAGVWLIGGLMRRACRPSVVTLVLALVTGLAALVTLLFGAEEFAVNFAAGEGLGFRAVCSFR